MGDYSEFDLDLKKKTTRAGNGGNGGNGGEGGGGTSQATTVTITIGMTTSKNCSAPTCTCFC
ncbi:hypothetical protein [Lacrimispora sp.]|uniref:hypothetical protein n=1 Tax=Lacrimispora sp. TaxID=2719234 RepID=UPI00289F32A9|nr:hypothetical protein [Lacrimispora sp.]